MNIDCSNNPLGDDGIDDDQGGNNGQGSTGGDRCVIRFRLWSLSQSFWIRLKNVFKNWCSDYDDPFFQQFQDDGMVFFFKYSQTDAQTTKTLATIAWTSSFAGKTKESLILDKAAQAWLWDLKNVWFRKWTEKCNQLKLTKSITLRILWSWHLSTSSYINANLGVRRTSQ